MRSGFFKNIMCVLSALVLIASGFTIAYAVDEDYDGYDDVTGEPVASAGTVETDPPYTEAPYTEPVYTDSPYTQQPYTEAPYTEAPYTEAPTEAYEETTNIYVPVQRGDIQQDPSEFVPPTVSKTVSQRSYSTNYTAGIVSWICVGVGLLLMFIVALSTKISGRSARRGL